MLGFVQSWLKPGANPIGIDFGTDTLRMAQVDFANGDFHLVAAASADVPSHMRHDPSARLGFFAQTVRELLASGNFRGRKAVLALPAAAMFIQHLRMARMDEPDMKKALPFEAAGKLPIDPNFALLRHVVAGEVYQDNEPKNEVVLMAASREMVKQLLATASKAKLDVVGMNVEPKALVDCFTHVYRRKVDADQTNLFVDIGAAATRAVIARGSQILFARVIPIGGDHFCRAVAAAMKISAEDAKVLRIKLAHVQPVAQPAPLAAAAPVAAPAPVAARPVAPSPQMPVPATDESDNNSFALLGAGLSAAAKGRENASGVAGGTAVPAAPVGAPVAAPVAAPVTAPAQVAVQFSEADGEAQRVEQACREPLTRLIEELGLCRRYYESCFPSKPVNRMVFVGGEARQTWLCQGIARGMMLAAQVGDPLMRMAKTTEIGIESGIDRRQPQPGWAVAIGLSMGPPVAAAAAATTADAK